MVREFHFEQRSHLFTTLAAECQDMLSESLSKNGSATIFVSGGTTPAPLYDALSKLDIAWKKVKVALVDERWVAADHSASNEALIRKSLLVNNAKAATFVGMKTAANTANKGVAETEANYKALPKPFTFAIVGMGNDGHTASLFPGADGLNAALNPDSEKLVAAIKAKPSAVTGTLTERMSMTVAALLQCDRIVVLITGEDKLSVFDQAMRPGANSELPIRALLDQEKVPVELYWAP
ncbi:MAG: 6-phosphogluconolactonase [Methylococcaceae bacterium]|nr:6-phosphogluconolactonase [Methylococcaceae bacterium]